jgi:antitoxin component HigA of HigAB toxin-antitoxin module
MEIHPIRNDKDHSAALKLIEQFWDAPDGSREADALDILAVLVDDYENTRWPIEHLDPVDLLKAHMAATGRSQADLAQVIGSRPRASEIIARKRALTISMIRNLASEWHLPAMLLIAPYNLKKASGAKQATPAKKKIGRKRRQKHAATGKRDAA